MVFENVTAVETIRAVYDFEGGAFLLCLLESVAVQAGLGALLRKRRAALFILRRLKQGRLGGELSGFLSVSFADSHV